MATQAAHVFPSYIEYTGTNQIKPSTDSIAVALYTAASEPAWNSTTWAYTTLSAFVTGASLTAVSGPAAITLTPTWTASGEAWVLSSATAMSWTASSSWSAQYAVFYDTTATVVTDPLVCYWDFGGTSSVTTGGTFTLTMPGTGLVSFTAS